ncbi:endoplasmic reticulum membrane-associated RNA degradation protein-like isoform X2 [Gigantopelta aegis]|uniref:endoplasmic reticulum membrane-associated RNA degradation protein-like isoform X2 n=1 Tax=Gigantopelta aegis TaxID=1735272 RepID=UPI001B889913|nr:endoplasmic reticulum membrane-associated RNA degradation protein-like isoform X2 [Gigantopelta aegis]
MANHLSIPAPRSALSPSVKKLICLPNDKSETQVVQVAGDVLTTAGTINFRYLQHMLPQSPDQTAEYFLNATQALSSICTLCQTHLYSYSLDDFINHYSHFLTWTGNIKLFEDCFKLLVSESPSEDVLGLLLVTSGLERALGDVFLLRGRQCPSMLKDLLVTQQLLDIFGPVVIQTLRVLIGLPISLNLRNLVWHGFPTPGEIPPRFACFLLLLVPSLGEVLQQGAIEARNITHRPAVSFHQTVQLQEQFPSFISSQREIDEVFFKSDFVQDDFIPIWKKALQLYEIGSFGFCLVLLMPQLEHALRRVFAAVNGCPERVLTAESSTLYTTFDEILDKFLPSGEENKMALLVGEPCMDLLFDLLVYPDGPRVRDRLSHGEVNLYSVPASLVHPVVYLSLFLCHKFIKDSNQNPVTNTAVSKISSYHSLFHPIAVLKQQVTRLLEFSAASSPWITSTPQLMDKWITKAGCDSCFEDNEIYIHIKMSALDVVKELVKQFDFGCSFTDLTKTMLSPFTADISFIFKILEQKTSTLYRGQQVSPSDEVIRETVIVSLLQRITAECHEVVAQTSRTLISRQKQLQNKQLRSRQRDNLQKLIDSCLDNMTAANQDTLKKVQRFLKMYLKFCENERTNTSPERNKWKECLDLFMQFLPKLKTYCMECQLVP